MKRDQPNLLTGRRPAAHSQEVTDAERRMADRAEILAELESMTPEDLLNSARQAFQLLFEFEDLRENSRALMDKAINSNEQLAAMVRKYLAAAQDLTEKFDKAQRDRQLGGKNRLLKNADQRAKQEAKAMALALWKERQEGRHPKLRTVEQFATEVMRRRPVLTSAKVICRWSAEWSKAVKEGRTPSC